MMSVLTPPFGLAPPGSLQHLSSSSEVYGTCTGVLEGVKVAGVLGDQQAALFGQACFSRGQAKCTYGTVLWERESCAAGLVPRLMDRAM